MAHKSNTPTLYAKHRGFFDVEKVIKSVQNWYVENNFSTIHIPKYKQNFPKPEGIERQVEMHGEKKVTGYVKMHIDIILHFFYLRDIELVRDGKKVKLQEGSVNIEIAGVLELDWQNRFSGSKFLEALDNFYRSYIIKYKIGDFWDDMVLDTEIEVMDLIKSELGAEVV
ncbi:hypothetical protein COV18_01145 [Candidatus Woesearchaeota archaeon CG10_big_fil_rev_8_21_14_0_10_37_12]|nr:MAG: hypothetical protein COV18_01145 [Candidatus Woesearchaeota archaeon CG10_big_fil_rev_8_21_14_0_10_37_12]